MNGQAANSYTTRIANLTSGGLNGAYRLGGDDGAAQTVFNDSSVDNLAGS